MVLVLRGAGRVGRRLVFSLSALWFPQAGATMGGLFDELHKCRMNPMNAHPDRTFLRLETGVGVTLLGTAINALLVALKVVVGLVTGSIALIADGIHSASDIATDLAVIGGIRLAARPPDSSHPYGHGRYETFAAGGVAIGLICVGLLIAWRAGSELYAHVISCLLYTSDAADE